MTARTAQREKGVITIAETLIVLAVGIALIITWMVFSRAELTNENARQAGRVIATYSRAAAEWLSEAPPAAAGSYGIVNLQDCADPAGARYLSCSYSSNTRLPLVFTAAGAPASLGDLVISVTLPASGAAGDIDFGVIRSGEDANADSLPDSRPDLAAIAHRTASRETGAGVSDFFELSFARSDPTGLVYDPSDSAFDQAAIDDLARLQARVGADVDSLFLRTDGTNEMQAGITFVNGVVVSPDGTSLSITGTGDLVVNTKRVTAPEITVSRLSATESLTVTPSDGVRGAGFDRFDQSTEVAANQASIATAESNIATNAANITANQASIATAETSIATNAANISSNAAGITANSASIATNAADILSLQNQPAPTPPGPEQCTPTEATVRASLPAGSITSVPSSCSSCGYWSYSSQSHQYRVRNLSTLACETRTLNVYTDLCLNSNGLCDGYCENSVTKC